MSNTKKATAKVSTEFVQELSEAVSETELLAADEEESENAEAAHSVETPAESQETDESEWETTGWGTLDQELTTQEVSEEASSGETDSAEQTSESSTEETTTEDSTEDDFETSAGFSALDTYDDTEETAESDTELETESETETETQEDAQDFSGLVIARVTNYVNVRSIPSEEGEIVGKLYDKSVGEFIEEKDGWYKIVSGNCTGYVKGEYCVVGEEAEALAKEVGTTYAIVNTTTLKVRKEASTESAVLGLVPIEEELVVVEELDGWVKIAIEEGDGYVSRDYVNLRTDFVHAESREEEEARLAEEARAREEARAAAAATEASRAQRQAEAQEQKSEANQVTIDAARNTAASSAGSEMGKAVINYATQFVGNPYVYGGSSLTNGTDCSGFVMSVYSNFGVSLPHSSSALRSKGYDVGGLENAQPGDIVCYSGHVGLYVGNGQIVHASTSRTGIIVSSATYRNILTVRRIF
ncbi:MAG: SH3 domain-containing protein [Lachnospiraceae bacterium]|nr:SH3 domain-containing protein [Lachnospiraceae bacterium]